ncbi:MAG: AbrB/MazE/SpoVT family DNA-binding domain-containing protein [Nitrospiraceae bacterium]|nr:AbrB/MazE/SpoVT family DNA-binding domain-containing protein [Nitrospiraceae bacterium]
MHRKVFSVGNSKGVSIPADYLNKLDLAVGAEVDVILDEDHDRIVIEPIRKKKLPKGLDKAFVAQVNEFIEQYRPALKELAKK